MVSRRFDTRDTQENRERRLAIFRFWSKGGTFVATGKQFGIKRARAREIVWTVIIREGGRSDRARAWMMKLDKTGELVKRYDEVFSNRIRRLKSRAREHADGAGSSAPP